jgi:hypothetical protein
LIGWQQHMILPRNESENYHMISYLVHNLPKKRKIYYLLQIIDLISPCQYVRCAYVNKWGKTSCGVTFTLLLEKKLPSWISAISNNHKGLFLWGHNHKCRISGALNLSRTTWFRPHFLYSNNFNIWSLE